MGGVLTADYVRRLVDPRLTPTRADLAAEHLRGLVDAPRYAAGQGMRIIAASAPLRRSPQAEAPLKTEALYGESVTVYDERAGWAWAQLGRDQYVGYLPSAALGAPFRTDPSSRRVAHARLSRPRDQDAAAHGAFARRGLDDRGIEGDFAVSEDGLYLWSRSVTELGRAEPDWVAVAERFIETPYLWVAGPWKASTARVWFRRR